MKKERKIIYLGAVMLVAFIVISVVLFFRSSERIEQGYLASEGSAAENFAVLTSQSIHLTDEQVKKLKSYSYDELMTSEENKALETLVSDKNFVTKVDYAYVMIHLKDDEVKYEVTEENKERFSAPVGTKLDIMWLLDVNVSESADAYASSNDNEDITRYSYYIEEDAAIFAQTPSYIFNSSEWGDHICGYAPLYSVEGTYIGVVGVELQTIDYNAYCGNAVRVLGRLVVVCLLMLTLVFIFIYCQYKGIQTEKTYTDVLTGLRNRTYYNERFVKCMNANKKQHKIFAMMIADVDFFKKVNDTFGHEVGDQVLIQMGAILLNNFDRNQVFRFGGEEFVAGIWVDSADELKTKMDQLFADVSGQRFTNLEITINISAGCSYAQADDVNGWLMSGMLKAADCKLYECKDNGRKQYRLEAFDPKKEYKKG